MACHIGLHVIHLRLHIIRLHVIRPHGPNLHLRLYLRLLLLLSFLIRNLRTYSPPPCHLPPHSPGSPHLAPGLLEPAGWRMDGARAAAGARARAAAEGRAPNLKGARPGPSDS